MNQFLNELEEGKFDAGADEPEPPSSPIKEDVDGGGTGAQGSAKQDDSAKNEDEFGIGLENEEAADNAGDPKIDSNGKASYDAKTPGKDEISVLPEGIQIMIRTIPPDIGRVKLETVSSQGLLSCSRVTLVLGCQRYPWICLSRLGRPNAKTQLLPGWLDQVQRGR